MFAIPIINSNRVIYHFASKYVYEASKLYITTGFINQRERESCNATWRAPKFPNLQLYRIVC
jgi:hypothetical protein